jgi:hypothetical protein
VTSRAERDDLPGERARLVSEARGLRDLSDRLIKEIATLRRLEAESRAVPIGSPEFKRLSQEITDHAHSVFRMSAGQEALGVEARFQDRTVNEVPREEVAEPQDPPSDATFSG